MFKEAPASPYAAIRSEATVRRKSSLILAYGRPLFRHVRVTDASSSRAIAFSRSEPSRQVDDESGG